MERFAAAVRGCIGDFPDIWCGEDAAGGRAGETGLAESVVCGFGGCFFERLEHRRAVLDIVDVYVKRAGIFRAVDGEINGLQNAPLSGKVVRVGESRIPLH